MSDAEEGALIQVKLLGIPYVVTAETSSIRGSYRRIVVPSTCRGISYSCATYQCALDCVLHDRS